MYGRRLIVLRKRLPASTRDFKLSQSGAIGMTRPKKTHHARASATDTQTVTENMGALYVVATPIGNLDDISARAIEVLCKASLIAAEDTRHSARLMQHIGATAPLISLHDHNESSRIEQLSERIQRGERIALISDAGTPLISDPGYTVVNALRVQGLPVIPVPGPCALITALCAAGLPTDRFRFEGFIGAKTAARQEALKALAKEKATTIFYESPHRIQALLTDIAVCLSERCVVLARELTKTFETFLEGTAETLLEQIEADPNQARGEFVVMIAGAPAVNADEAQADVAAEQLLEALLAEGVGVKQSAAVAARVIGGRKQHWYQQALALRAQE